MFGFVLSQLTMRNLLSLVRTNLIKERADTFMKGEAVYVFKDLNTLVMTNRLS